MPPPTAIIACAVLEDEVRTFSAGLPHITGITILPQGLHNEPATLNRSIREAVAEIESNQNTHAIALVYGLCSRGIENIPLSRCKLVVPRAHDCITLFLGSKERYKKYQTENPAIYWYSPGWNKAHAVPGPHRFQQLRERYEKKFDPDAAHMLLELEKEMPAQYTTAAYTDLDVGDREANIQYTKSCACHMGWNFTYVQGDSRLLHDLLEGNWDNERFLLVPPHHHVELTADDNIIKSVPDRQ